MEICRALNIRSKGTVHRYVKSLENKGYIKKTGRSWRGVRLSAEYNRRLTVLSLAGRVTANRPIETIAGQDEINISELLLGPDRFVLKVTGDSMAEANILDGDLLIMQKADTAESGNIVLISVDGEVARLRRLRRHGSRIELIPANSSLASMIYPADRVSIQGRVIGQVRLY